MNDENYINCEEIELSALENLAIMWDVTVHYEKYDTYTLTLKSTSTGAEVQTFTGPLKKVLRDADAWFDGVVFTFDDPKGSQL
jgi:hypothetical protein